MAILYHYCSSLNFLSIIENRSIWLSSLSLSNDNKEGRILEDVFLELFNDMELKQEIIEYLKGSIKSLNEILDGLGFCLSRQGDLLSQWRGYAMDGTGFSIGFSSKYIDLLEKSLDPKEPGFQKLKILYKPIEHKNSVLPVVDQIKMVIKDKNIQPPKWNMLNMGNPELFEKQKNEFYKIMQSIGLNALTALPKLFALKHPAFSEEREIRLVSYLIKNSDDKCQFHISNNKLVPHREFKLIPMKIQPIEKVILGPKNQTPEFVVEKLLTLNGFHGVKVRRSDSTYR